MRDAFARSDNIAAVRVEETAGRPAIVRAARDLGVTSPLNDDPTHRFLTLGVRAQPEPPPAPPRRRWWEFWK